MPRRTFRETILDLLRFERGHSTFIVGEDGDTWLHQATVVTVKMERGETVEGFHARIRREFALHKGDTIDILNNGGKADTARITMLPR